MLGHQDWFVLHAFLFLSSVQAFVHCCELCVTQFRGGATQHGPKPRSHEIGLQKQVRRLGLKVALSSRIAEGKV
jgi:ribosomal protein L4